MATKKTKKKSVKRSGHVPLAVLKKRHATLGKLIAKRSK